MSDCCNCKSKYNDFSNSFYGPRIDESCNMNMDCGKCLPDNFYEIYNNYTNFKNCCFLATKPGDNNNLFVLNKNYEEVNKIILNKPSYKSNINGIVYDFDSSKIYISYPNGISSFSVNGDFIKNELNSFAIKEISNISIVSNSGCYQNVKSTPVINTIGISECVILVSYNINDSSFISALTTSGNLVQEKYIDDNIFPYKILDEKCELQICAKKDGDYLVKYILDKNKGICKHQHNYCEIIFDDECRVDIVCPDLPCDIDGSLCEVIRSVAMIEKCIAKLICLESEKIKKAIEEYQCNDKLLKVNDSVCKTIDKITCLEQVLKEKLEIAVECYKKI